jgi:hypothetical protein
MAKRGDPLSFFKKQSFIPLSMIRNCDFSFCGFKNTVLLIEKLERESGTEPDALIPQTADLCASLQYTVAYHVMKRLARAITFIERTRICGLTHEEITKDNLLKRMTDATMDSREENALHLPIVLSGGVACNDYFASCLKGFCANFVPHHETTVLKPVIPRPKKLCSDNGIMIAWNAVLKLRTLQQQHDWNDERSARKMKQRKGQQIRRPQQQQQQDEEGDHASHDATSSTHATASTSPSSSSASSSSSAFMEDDHRGDNSADAFIPAATYDPPASAAAASSSAAAVSSHQIERDRHREGSRISTHHGVRKEEDGRTRSESEHIIRDQWMNDASSPDVEAEPEDSDQKQGRTESGTVCRPNEDTCSRMLLLQTRQQIESLVPVSRMSLGYSLRDVVTEANIAPSYIHRSIFLNGFSEQTGNQPENSDHVKMDAIN